MKHSCFNYLIVLIFACLFQQTRSQTLIINEVSNGPAGNQEYVELVVASNSAVYNCGSTAPPCIDIRGWIFDDNSGYHGSSGVATGAVRFSQNILWSCVPVGTIILIYNGSDRNPAIPADDLSLNDGNCRIIAPLSSTLFESNNTTPGAMACSYPPTGWTSGGSWSNTLLANPGDCARIVNLAGCEVFSVCWGSDNLNNLIYISGSGAQKVYFFNGGNPAVQANWNSGTTTPSPGLQTPGAANNAANAAYISQFNNGCAPITPVNVTASAVNAGCTCTGSATATATGSIPGYTYAWYDSAFAPIGQTTATASGLCAGVYNVIATSSTGCSDTANITITSAAAAGVTVNSQTVCAGSNATLTANPSASGGTYLWSPGGQTTQAISLSPATAGTYTVTYTMAGCSSTATGSVTVTPLPVVNINQPTICNGSTAGLTASGATSYSWTAGAIPTGVSTADAMPSATTTYTVTGTTAGCSSTAASTVTVNPAPLTTVNSATICSGSTAALTAGGATSYTWSAGAISTGINTANAQPAVTTTYTVTGTTAGCSSTAISSVTVNPTPITTVNSATICIGNTAMLTAGGAASYTWSAGAISTGINTANAQPAVTTTYTVTGTTTGCSSTATSTVTVNSPPITIVNSPTVCAGDTAALTASGATSYSWTAGATPTGIATADATPSTTTSYTVTGTSAGCSSTAVSTVTVNPAPLTVVDSATICPGSNAVLTASGAASYTWSAGTIATGINTASVQPAVTTTYTVTGTSAGCASTAVALVTVSAPFFVDAGVNDSLCFGENTLLTAVPNTPGYSYSWSSATTLTSGIIPNPSASPAVTTTYSVIVTDVAGCTGTDSVTVYVDALMDLSAISSLPASCYGMCDGQATVIPSGGSGTYTGFLWSSGCTTATCIQCAGADTVIVTDSWGCTAINSITIAQPGPVVIIPVSDAVICNSGNTTLTATATGGSSAVYSYAWSPSTGLSNSAISNPVASPATTTAYILNVTDGNGCSADPDTVVVTVNSTLSATANGNAVICSGNSSTISVTASSGSGSYNYSWSPVPGLDNPVSNAPQASPSSTTTYTVTVTDGCSTPAIDSVTITILPAPAASINLSSDSGCAPLCISLNALSAGTGADSIHQWSWQFSDGGSASVQNPSHCFNDPGSYNIILTMISVNGCSQVITNTGVVNVFPQPAPEFTSNLQETDLLNPVIQFADQSLNATGFNWNFGDLQFSSQPDPEHSYNLPGTYLVTLIATNQYGCVDSVTHEIIINDLFTFYAPNAFTPDDNNRNDLFLPVGNGWKTGTYELRIYDRWGNLCFLTTDPAKGWDGKIKKGPEAAQQDVYVWKVSLTDIFNEPHSYTGSVIIVK